ncbi:MAG: hypothetical protein REH83_06845, partial [Rickettsiella sp.]|nr:hypothetical protein [Rickettsiella sp.]
LNPLLLIRKPMRYRMLDVRIWCDQKFRSLSPLKPSGQALFIYLLTNPNTTSIPGLYRAGAAAMAEELGWSVVSFRRALKEVINQGLLKVDLKSRVIFIRNAIKYNKPQSPNVVKSWALHWDEIPECALKDEAYQTLKSFVEGLGKAFAQAFEEALRKPSVKKQNVQVKPFPNQDQEQEQEQVDQFKTIKQFSRNVSPVKKSHAQITDFNLNSLPQAAVVMIPLRNNEFYYVTREQCRHWQATYKAIDVLKTLQQLLAWNEQHVKRRKARATILQHIHTWFTQAQYQKKNLSTRGYLLTFEYNQTIAKNWLQPDKRELAKTMEFQALQYGID